MNIDNLTKQLGASTPTNRRQVLQRLGLGVAGLAALKLMPSSARAQSSQSDEAGQDVAVLQFAPNLEYLEAEFYTYATTGHGIEQEGIAVTGQGQLGPVIIKNNPEVPFTDPDIRQIRARNCAGRAGSCQFHSGRIEVVRCHSGSPSHY